MARFCDGEIVNVGRRKNGRGSGFANCGLEIQDCRLQIGRPHQPRSKASPTWADLEEEEEEEWRLFARQIQSSELTN